MKKELKIQHPNLAWSPIDLFADIDPSKTNKFLPFLLNQYYKIINDFNIPEAEAFSYIKKKFPFLEVPTKDYFRTQCMLFLTQNVFSEEQVYTLYKFNELLEKNRIDNSDILTYQSFRDISDAIEESLLKYDYKEKEKDVQVFLDNEQFLVVRPLSYEAVKKYGYNTKWCVTSTNKNYWIDYSQNGTLFIVINKINKNKYAFNFNIRHCSEVEISCWNAADRRIDSYESDIDPQIIQKLFMEVKTNPVTTLDIRKNLGMEIEDYETYEKGTQDFDNEVEHAQAALVQDQALVMSDEEIETLSPICETKDCDKVENKEKTTIFVTLFTWIKKLFKKRKHMLVLCSSNVRPEEVERLRHRPEITILEKDYDIVFMRL